MRTRHSVRPARALTGILLAATLALAGCGGSDSSGGGTSDSKAAAGGAPQRGASDSYSGDAAKGSRAKAPDLTANRIIRTASLTVRVKDVPKALDEARTTTENAGGYIGDESTTRDARGHERTRVVLRVPVEKYDEVLADLQGTGRLIDRTSKAQDVTDQVVDVDSRIRSQRASVARVRELMDKATRLSDVVTLEGELSSREADLEALLAQQASLKDRTSLATITLSLSETPVEKAAKDDSPGFVDAVSGGWHVFVTMLRWIALALGAVLPFAALVALLVLVWLRVVRRRLPLRAAPAAGAAGPGPLPRAAGNPVRRVRRAERARNGPPP
ncbi:DUF4349 domain-containing protein [Streptomyces sp. HUAS TT20]|uniref:DUF4349 domain-containing protein n=1 Tax=Streptomyces sp. HUAS TT20 TaxID=3447509 RepID=UPI0021D9EA45|nr:DUF4349 domain-containing protein [Streptomyces sp. HUAS 15-9]UXY30610.1 DUF4349 domain-containing protein [Streptomyces sp. HUAS 15-9]